MSRMIAGAPRSIQCQRTQSVEGLFVYCVPRRLCLLPRYLGVPSSLRTSEHDGPRHTSRDTSLVERAYTPRLSASVGAAIRQARAGRYSLAALARRSRTSVGVLSLIERGRGNPSFETLARIADALEVSLASLIEGGTGAANREPSALRGSILPGPWDDRGESPAQDVADSSTAEGVTVLRPGSPTVWRDSMFLRPGQEAVVLVRAGTVEMTLRDRSEDFQADEAGEPLSVDISVRDRPSYPRWSCRRSATRAGRSSSAARHRSARRFSPTRSSSRTSRGASATTPHRPTSIDGWRISALLC